MAWHPTAPQSSYTHHSKNFPATEKSPQRYHGNSSPFVSAFNAAIAEPVKTGKSPKRRAAHKKKDYLLSSFDPSKMKLPAQYMSFPYDSPVIKSPQRKSPQRRHHAANQRKSPQREINEISSNLTSSERKALKKKIAELAHRM